MIQILMPLTDPSITRTSVQSLTWLLESAFPWLQESWTWLEFSSLFPWSSATFHANVLAGKILVIWKSVFECLRYRKVKSTEFSWRVFIYIYTYIYICVSFRCFDFGNWVTADDDDDGDGDGDGVLMMVIVMVMVCWWWWWWLWWKWWW